MSPPDPAAAPDVAGAVGIDPLAPAPPGRWEHGPVVVRHDDRAPRETGPPWCGDTRAVATTHFTVHRAGGRLLVRHRLGPDDLDDDVAGLVAAELGDTGVVASAADFERVVTGLVRSTVDDPLAAWSTFYANTLATLRAAPAGGPSGAPPESSLAAFAPVHRRARAEVRGTRVLDLGCCFGFLALTLADAGQRVVAADHTPGTARLLAAVAAATGRELAALVADARAVPLADGAVDTVLAIHLLEHLDAADAPVVLAEMCRVARRRVVVAVPYERVPDPVYGHRSRFDPRILAALGARAGARAGFRFRTDDDHGGWLVGDRCGRQPPGCATGQPPDRATNRGPSSRGGS